LIWKTLSGSLYAENADRARRWVPSASGHSENYAQPYFPGSAVVASGSTDVMAALAQTSPRPPPIPIPPTITPRIKIGTPPSCGKSPIHTGAILSWFLTLLFSSSVDCHQRTAVFALRIADSPMIIRAYFSAVQHAAANGSITMDANELANWTDWALGHAGEIDPIQSNDFRG
jgi:hypothetical protein